jgi:hypothetical protein
MNVERTLLVVTLAVLACVVLLGATSGQVGRYQMAGTQNDFDVMWRLDTSTGEICALRASKPASGSSDELGVAAMGCGPK